MSLPCRADSGIDAVAPAGRVPRAARVTLLELVSAVRGIAEDEEEAIAIVLDVLASEELRVTNGVPGRPLHRI